MKLKNTVLIFLFLLIPIQIFAQLDGSTLNTFGFYQNQFQYDKCTLAEEGQTTFLVQQLNLFFQKDITTNWTALVNIEFFNSYSSQKKWGGLNLEEAWVRYRKGKEFNLKLGMQIPIFNNLNEIKNKMPLLPYIIRPLAYETSFSEFIDIDQFVPSKAYIQAYGFLPWKKAKFDYAFYIGNSPNVNNNTNQGQTGVDTTSSFLFGGRIGFRYGELKTGLSLTKDKVNVFKPLQLIYGGSTSRFENITRTRLGGDLSYNYRKLLFESEFILLYYDDDVKEIDFNKEFYYTTLGYFISDKLFIYGSYCFTNDNYTYVFVQNEGPPLQYAIIHEDLDILVPNAGLAYHFNDRITFKMQLARAIIHSEYKTIVEDQDIDYIDFAVSIFF